MAKKITAATQRRAKKEQRSKESKDMRYVVDAARKLLKDVRPQGRSHQEIRCPACDAKEIWGKKLTEKSFHHNENCTYVLLRTAIASLDSGQGIA